jgi:tetratricopeptide (TPR) repeat protein
MADVKRADATSGLTSTKDWPCDMEPTLQKAVEASPHKGQANRELGQFYLAHDQPAKAIPLLQRAVQLDNKDYAASKALGIAWLRNGQFEEAHKQFSALVDVGGEASAQAQGQAHERAEIYQLLAHSDEGLGMFKEAAEDYRKASLEEPSEQSVFGIGYELVLAGSAADALVVFQDGKQKYAQSVSLRIGIGTAQFLLGHASDALRNFLEASDLDPSDARPYPLVAAASGVASDQSERVLATLKRFLDLNPGNPLANYLYALILSRDGTHADTRRIEGLLKNAIHLDPRLAKAHLQLADLYAERGDYQEAIPEYETAARVAPDLSETHYRLAIAYKRMGRSGQSAREMQIFQQQKTKQSTATGNDGIDLAQFISVMDAPSESSVPQTTCAAPVQSRP